MKLAWKKTHVRFKSVVRSAASRPAPDPSASRTASRLGFVGLLVFGLIGGLLGPAAALADGLDTWTSRISGSTHSLHGIAYGNNQFVVVGDTGLILTSPDGSTWASRDSGTANTLTAVAFGNHEFVAVGIADFTATDTSTVILTSPDGVTWTRRVSGDYQTIYTGVSYGNNTFVVVGSGGKIRTSPDGITWTDKSPYTDNDPFEGVIYADGQFVAVGGIGLAPSLIFTSTDAITWTRRDSGTGDGLAAVAYGNGVYVVTGPRDSATGHPVILTSPDAITWTSRGLFSTASGLKSVAYGDGEFVAVGGPEVPGGSLLITSADGVTWTRRNSSTATDLLSIANGVSTFVAVGSSGTIIQSGGTATPQAASITAPTSPLPGTTATFNWDAGIGVDAYWLYVGTNSAGSDLFNSNGWVTNRTQTVNNLPQTGQPIYVRLYSRAGATFLALDYVYTAAQPPAPDITVQQPAGTGLTDGTASIGFGNVNVASISAAVTFTLLNSGTASLTGLSVSEDGANGADFALGTLGATTLAPNASTTFTVTFTPGGAGARSAAIHVASNVSGSKNPFDISLRGSGVTAGLSLAQALDTSGLTWITGGDANWSGQTVTTHDGMDAAQSGSAADSQETWMQTTVTGPGTLSFWWKVDSLQNFDYLNFEMDEVEQFFISGSVAWEQRTLPIATGSHTLRWVYAKDVGAAGADAGWVDQVQMAGTNNPGNVSLSVLAVAGNFTLTWPIAEAQYLPEYTDSLVSPNWIPVPETSSTAGDNFVVTVAAGEPTRFFRLRRQ